MKKGHHILIVEDEEHLSIGLRFNFEAEGYRVAVAGDGPSGLRIFRDAEPPIDLIILDLMLPGMSGYEICRQIRTIDPSVPILVLSARTLGEDKAKAFDFGSDQYLTKPFELVELISRVRNLLERRHGGHPVSPEQQETVSFGTAEVDFRTHEVKVAGEPRTLTPLELQLLRLFINNEGVVLTRGDILKEVWNIDPPPATRTVDNFVMRLRKHFEEDPANPKHILSVRGAGYRFMSRHEDSPEK
ncbi:Sensory transduction protein regX3 [Planctomycetes bacterium Pan216]|uniref:Sensory transduction protein regX3 n=1 Tax=Kolteria novifilia TaxID=2527975 RepID=A0A518B9J4_9BACT|nr:Sensory transduction protein regX3 [Planctomycetes bacterium Pan216]